MGNGGCSAKQSCTSTTGGRTCACIAGFADCDGLAANGCEHDVRADNAHCGACGSVCPTGAFCGSGTCLTMFASDGSDGAFNPTGDAVLPARTYHFTTIIIPAGVTVTTNGTGVLELRATGAVTIAGVVDVNGSRGGNGAAYNACAQGATGGGGSSGTSLAPGVNGLQGCPGAGGGGGGGASGGVLRIATGATLTVSESVTAAGGAGGNSNRCDLDGGAGDLGRIRISAPTGSCSLSGTFDPPLVGGCTPTPGPGVAGRTYVSTL